MLLATEEFAMNDGVSHQTIGIIKMFDVAVRKMDKPGTDVDEAVMHSTTDSMEYVVSGTNGGQVVVAIVVARE